MIKWIKAKLRAFVTRITKSSILSLVEQTMTEALHQLQNKQTMLEDELGAIKKDVIILRFAGEKQNAVAGGGAPKRVKNPLSIEEAFHALAELQPRAYPIWRQLFENGTKAYENDVSNNCLVEGHMREKAFDFFGELFLHGNVLDVGCGPQPIPSYLRDYPVEQICGLDPLMPYTKHPFAFQQGFCEFIPWEDAQFDCVTAMTSLDHVLDLDKAVGEIYRVLKKGGYFIPWIGIVPNAEPYNPQADDLRAIDAYHMFHFDAPWFEEMMGKYFTLKTSYIDKIGYGFYCYVK